MAHQSRVAIPFIVAALTTVGWLGARGKPPSRAPQHAMRTRPQVDPRADRLLHRMSDYLAGLRSFSVNTDNTTEVVLRSGQKIQLGAASRVSVERPNRVRSDRKGQLATVSLYYDGRTVTIYGRRANLYASTTAPPTIDRTIDFLRARLDADIPAADLLFSNPYEGLMEDVVSGTDLGAAEVNGVPCHHLAYRGHETDWQIWIEDGPRPLPVKYVITSKTVSKVPEFEVELRDWNVNATFRPGFFSFQPPAGAARIEFFTLASRARQEQPTKRGE